MGLVGEVGCACCGAVANSGYLDGGAAYAGTFGAWQAPATLTAVWQPPVQVTVASDHTGCAGFGDAGILVVAGCLYGAGLWKQAAPAAAVRLTPVPSVRGKLRLP